MVIVEDTRNQVGKHFVLNERLRKMGHKVIRSKLFVGDYARLDNQMVCVDTKQGWLEVASNLTKQHDRFRDECLRAQENGIRLVILVEENVPASDWESPTTKAGKPLTQVKGGLLAKIIETMQTKYGVEFAYCDKIDTAKKIIEILGGI